MTLSGLFANYEDLRRIERLEKAGHFAPGTAYKAQLLSMRYMFRITELAIVPRIIPYPGPTVTYF